MGQSNLHGELTAELGRAKPDFHGTIFSENLNPADFKADKPAGAAKGGEEAAATSGKQVFSDAPLGLNALTQADADFVVKIDTVTLATGTLKQTAAKLELKSGLLSLTPVTTVIGDGTVEAQVKVNGATSPAQVSMVVKAPDVPLADLLHLIQRLLSCRARRISK